ncbi:phosphorylase kinase, delta [Podila minutissima]|nr:phosphorylase kinase, delta [Podila minutissima]
MATAGFTQEELDSYKESFDIFDKDSNGAISATELRALLKLLGEKVHAQSIDDNMKEFDLNNDKEIDFEEFLLLVNKYIKNKGV